MFVGSASLADISKKLATSANWTWNGSNIETSEVMILADKGNAAAVQVSVDAAVGANNHWPLAAGESLVFSVNNLSRVHINIVADTEIAYVAYTR
jgi:homospermidine synthase